MAALPLASGFATGISTTATADATAVFRRRIHSRPGRVGLRVSCVNWDPEGILGAPQTGHLARIEFKRRLEKDANAREEFERQVREETERRRALRDSRVAPDTAGELIEYFLDTEAQELEFEMARLRPRLNDEFFAHLKFELGNLRFAVTKTQDMEDRLIELEALEKALHEGKEAFDRMQADLIAAKENLAKILSSKDVKATLLDMVECNALSRSLLTLLDENIANAQRGDQMVAAAYMEKVRAAMLKYMTV